MNRAALARWRFGARLAWRWLRAPGAVLGTTLVIVCLAGIAVAVAALVLTIGVMDGFHAELTHKFRGLQPHLHLMVPDDMSDAVLQQVQAQAPEAHWFTAIEGDALLQVPGGDGSADLMVRMSGVPPALLAQLSGVRWSFLVGAPDDTVLRAGAVSERARTALRGMTDPGLLVGSQVLASLALPDDALRVRLTAPLGLLDPSGELRPLARNMTVNGFFSSGVVAEDSQRVYVARDVAQAALGLQARVTVVGFVQDDAQVATIATRLRRHFSGQPVTLRTWHEQNGKLFAALALEQRVMQVILGCMMGLSAVSVIGVMLTIVRAKQRQLATLAACGASPHLLATLVQQMGLWLGGVGAGLGIGVAGGVAVLLRAVPIQLGDAFYLPVLPVQLRAAPCVAVGLTTVVVALLCARYPARLVRRMDLADALRVE